jgi:heptosyltransferase-2
MAKKYLIIQTAFIGDVILATSLIENLKGENPASKIDVLVKKENQSVLKGNPHIHELFLMDKSKKISSIFSLIRSFRKRKYDVTINLHRFASSGLISILSGAKEVRGFNKNPFSIFYSKKFDHEIKDGVHETDRNNTLIEDLIVEKSRRPYIHITSDAYEKVKSYQSIPYYCVAPASVWKTKEAPPQIWNKTIGNLISKECRVYLLGAAEDFQKCEQLKTTVGSDQLVNLAGKLSLIESAALMKSARRNYVNDSAPLHLASATNAPVTAFFCSTSPSFGFGPLSDDAKIIEVQGLECKPCGLHGFKSCPKGHFKCGNELESG